MLKCRRQETIMWALYDSEEKNRCVRITTDDIEQYDQRNNLNESTDDFEEFHESQYMLIHLVSQVFFKLILVLLVLF